MAELPARINPNITEENVGLGAALIVGAFFLVALMSAFGKMAGALSTGVLVFFQTSISLLVLAPWLLRGGLSKLKTQRPLMHLVRALAGLLSQALMFVAIRKMPLMSAVLLSNSAPLLIPIVAWLWMREKIGAFVWASLLVGLVGVTLILKPGPELLTNPASLIAVLAAVASAIALVTVNRLSTTDTTQQILFYYFLISSAVTAPFLLLPQPWGWLNPSREQWWYLIGVGVCMGFAQLMIVLAYRKAKPSKIASFNYSVVVFSGLLGWIFWHDSPDLVESIGVMLVSFGGVLATHAAGPNSRGHMLWPGHWNLPFRRHSISPTLHQIPEAV